MYYNPETEERLPLSLIEERTANQTLEPLQAIIPIDQILHNALVMAVELLRPAMGVIEESTVENARTLKKQSSNLVSEPQETDISSKTTIF